MRKCLQSFRNFSILLLITNLVPVSAQEPPEIEMCEVVKKPVADLIVSCEPNAPKSVLLLGVEDIPKEFSMLLPKPQKKARYLMITTYNDNVAFMSLAGVGNDKGWTYGLAATYLEEDPGSHNTKFEATLSSQLFTKHYFKQSVAGATKGDWFWGFEENGHLYYWGYSKDHSQEEIGVVEMGNPSNYTPESTYISEHGMTREHFRGEVLQNYRFGEKGEPLLWEDFKKIYGEYYQINFIEENKVSVALSRKILDKALVWHARGDVSLINQKKIQPLLATQHQKLWHSFLGEDLARQYVYVPTTWSRLPQIGAEIEVGLETFQERTLSNKCSLKLSESLFVSTGNKAYAKKCVKATVQGQLEIQGKQERKFQAQAIFDVSFRDKRVALGSNMKVTLFTKSGTQWFTGINYFTKQSNNFYSDKDGVWFFGFARPLFREK